MEKIKGQLSPATPPSHPPQRSPHNPAILSHALWHVIIESPANMKVPIFWQKKGSSQSSKHPSNPTKPFGRTCKVKDVGSMPDSPQKDQGKKRAKTTLLMTFATLTKQTWANEGNTRPAPRMVHRTALRTCISSIKSRTQRQRGTDTAGGRPDTNSEKVKLHTNLWSTKKNAATLWT